MHWWSLAVRVPSGCGPAAGDEREGGQPEQSPEAGEGGCRTGQQSGGAAGEEQGRLVLTMLNSFLLHVSCFLLLRSGEAPTSCEVIAVLLCGSEPAI